MQRTLRVTGLLLAAFLALVTSGASAQRSSAPAQTGARWDAWLGCWAPESPESPSIVGARRDGAVTCVVPVASSKAVDELTVADGAVVARKRLHTSGAQPFHEDSCRGTETTRWSASGRRMFVRARYACEDSLPGASATLLAFSPKGEWLRISEVRAGGGAIVSTERLREVGTPAGLPADMKRMLGGQRLAIATARAAASAPITVEEVVDALGALDSSVVRAWVLVSEQHFALNAEESALLARANLPASVLYAMLGATASDRQSGARTSSESSSVFANAPVYGPPVYPVPVYSAPTYAPPTAYAPPTTYVCPPFGCYAAPYPMAYDLGVYPTYGAYPYGYSPYLYRYSRPRAVHRAQPPMWGVPAGSQRPIVAVPQAGSRAPNVYMRRRP